MNCQSKNAGNGVTADAWDKFLAVSRKLKVGDVSSSTLFHHPIK